MQVTPLRSRIVNGVTQRMNARLLGVALVPQGAYAAATVIGIRKPWRDDQRAPSFGRRVQPL